MALINSEELKRFGNTLNTKLDQYKSDRRLKEIEMMQDLRQYRAKYDPKTASDLEAAGRSKVYPRDTRLKLIGFVAKMMEMMFPASEKNWSVVPEEYPDLAAEDFDRIIQTIEQKRAQNSNGEPPAELTSEEVASAVESFAKERAANMEKEIQDQLTELPVEYPQICKHTLHSGALYGWGVVEGPLTRVKTERTYAKDKSGRWIAQIIETPRPDFERVRSWDIYPDMSAKTWNEQEGLFRRRVFSRHDLTALIDRADFEGEIIKQYLTEHDEGNYKAEPYEAELRMLDTSGNVKNLHGRRYEIYRYFGFLSAKEMVRIGVDIKDEDLYKDVLVDIWFISGDGEGTIIKAEPAVFGEHVGHQYHPYFYDDEEEAGLLAVSLPSVVRDSQLKLCSVDRMIMDNAAACLGPIVEVDKSRLTKEQKVAGVNIGAFSTIYTDSSNDSLPNNNPVLRPFQIDSHITELLEIKRDFKSVMDMESNVQPVSLGDPTGVGEAFRTSGNFSQLTGAANMMTKDQVRAFDRFTSSLIGATVRWNLKFNPKKEIKGDFQAIGRGNISLVAKEVRGAALAQWRTTLSPREQVMLKTWDLLGEELRSRDLSVDDILLSRDEAEKALAAYDAAQSQAVQTEQGLTQAKTQRESASAQKTQAEAQELLSGMQQKIALLTEQANQAVAKATESMAKAKGVKQSNDLNTIKLILDQISAATGAGGEAPGGAARASE